MGRQIVCIPPDFVHPMDEDGGFIPGAHLECLFNAGDDACTAFQIYENTTEGTPVSPVFETRDDLHAWLVDCGYASDAAEAFILQGFSPLMVLTHEGIVDGIAGLREKKS